MLDRKLFTNFLVEKKKIVGGVDVRPPASSSREEAGVCWRLGAECDMTLREGLPQC